MGSERAELDGVLKPRTPLSLEEHEVGLQTRTTAAVSDEDDPTGWKTVRALVGCITEELVARDVSVNHDLYLYWRDQ